MKQSDLKKAIRHLKKEHKTVRDIAKLLGITDTLLHKYINQGWASYRVACEIEHLTHGDFTWRQLVKSKGNRNV